MSRSVDEKVVKMSLENAGFKSKILSTLSSITRLDQAFKGSKNIDLSRSVSSVNSLKGAVSRFSMRPLEAGADSVRTHFSAMSVAAIASIGTIVSRATSAGMNLAKSLSIKPMLEGFDMYQNKLKTIQVIHANTGASIGKISGVLASLNDYANKTVYSFKDMTTNLGTFTAAGVGINTAKTDMIGLSNLAAASGSSTQQAATAMYQLSQAVASGKVGLQDWNSVVNAGMGGTKFQNALKKTGMAMGKNIKMSDNFRDSLQRGWLTSDVLNKTLADFANNKSMLKAATQAKTFSDVMDAADDDLKSGWAQTWELIVGNYKQAPKLFTAMQTSISNMITKSANDRNKLLGDFVKLGGRTVVIKSIENALTAVGKVLHTVHQAFQDVFPPATGKSLLSAAKSFEAFTKGMIMSSKTASDVRAIFRGLFSAIDIGIKVVKMIASALLGMVPHGAGDGILSLIAKVANMVTAFDKALGSSKGLGAGMQGLVKVFQGVGIVLGDLGSAAGLGLGALIDGVKKVYAYIGPVAKAIGGFIKGIFSAVTPKDVAGTGVLAAGVYFVTRFKAITGSLKDALDKFGDVFSNASSVIKNLDGIKDALKAWTTSIKAKTLMEIAGSMLAIAAAMKILASIPGVGIAKGLETMAVALLGMITALKAISKLGFAAPSAMAAAVLIQTMAFALLELSGAMKIISTIDANGIAKGLFTLAAQLVIMVGALKLMSKINGSTIGTSISIGILAGALLTLSVSMKVLSSIDMPGVVQGLVAMGGILAEVAVFIKLVNGLRFSPVTALAIGIVASGILVMSGSVAALGAVPFGVLIQGLAGLGSVLVEIALFSKVVNGAQVTLASVGIIAIAGALAILTPSVLALGAIPFAHLAQGLIGMGVALGEVILAMRLSSGAVAGAASLVVAAAAVAMLVPPLTALSLIPAANMATALIGLAAALGIIAVAALALNGGALGLLAFAAATTAVGLAVAAIGLGLSAFAAALVALAGLTSAQCARIGQNFVNLLQSLSASIPLIVQIGVRVVTGFAAGLAQAIPSLANSGLQMILGLLNAIRANIGQITIAAAEIMVNFANALAQEAPALATAGLQLVVSLVNSMANGIRANSQQIVSAVLNMVEAIFEVIIDAGVKIITIMFGWIPGVKGAAKSLGNSAKEAMRESFDIKSVGSQGAQGFVDGVNSHRGGAHAAGAGLKESAKNGTIGSFVAQGSAAGLTYNNGVGSRKGGAHAQGNGLFTNAKSGATGSLSSQGSHAGSTYASGVGSHKGNAHSQGSGLFSGARGGATGSLSSQGSHAGSTYVSGVGGHRGDAHSAGSGLGSNAKSGSRVSLYSEGSNAGSGFSRGIRSWVGDAARAAESMARAAKTAVRRFLGIHSPSRVLHSLGAFTAQGFSNGISDNTYRAKDSATAMGKTAMNATKAAVQGIQESLDNNLDFNPVVTPQLDTKAFKESADKANSYLASSVGILPTAPMTQNVKMDLSPLVNKVAKNEVVPTQDNVKIYLTNYGTLDSVTARKWAQPISEALEKVRKNTIRQGGAFA